jgi:hypothetical protein
LRAKKQLNTLMMVARRSTVGSANTFADGLSLTAITGGVK